MRTLWMLGTGLVAGALQAAELHVPAGQERVLNEPVMQLERLVLEDGATLRLAPGLNHLELRAQQAWLAYLRDRQLTSALGWKKEEVEFGGWGFAARLEPIGPEYEPERNSATPQRPTPK